MRVEATGGDASASLSAMADPDVWLEMQELGRGGDACRGGQSMQWPLITGFECTDVARQMLELDQSLGREALESVEIATSLG